MAMVEAVREAPLEVNVSDRIRFITRLSESCSVVSARNVTNGHFDLSNLFVPLK